MTTINYNHGIDMQQVFAQLAVQFHAGGLWWLTDQEEELLEAQNNSHRRISVIRELVMAEFDPDLPPEKRKAMTATEVLKAAASSIPATRRRRNALRSSESILVNRSVYEARTSGACRCGNGRHTHQNTTMMRTCTDHRASAASASPHLSPFGNHCDFIELIRGVGRGQQDRGKKDGVNLAVSGHAQWWW